MWNCKNRHPQKCILATHTNLKATCIILHTFFCVFLFTYCCKKSTLRQRGPHLLHNAHNQLYSHRYESGTGNCKLRHCPAAKSALSGMVSSSCLCSPTACNESSMSEPWHAQMINWWQRELIKEIKLGTQPPQCSTCTCITRASSRKGIIHLCQSFLSDSYTLYTEDSLNVEDRKCGHWDIRGQLSYFVASNIFYGFLDTLNQNILIRLILY